MKKEHFNDSESTASQERNYLPTVRLESEKESLSLHNFVQESYNNGTQMALNNEHVCLFNSCAQIEEPPSFHHYQNVDTCFFQNANLDKNSSATGIREINLMDEAVWSYVAERRLTALKGKLRKDGSSSQPFLRLGDAQIRMTSICRLLGPKPTSRKCNNDLWLDDETINGMTNVIAKRWTTSESGVVFINSQMIQYLVESAYGEGVYSKTRSKIRKEAFQRIIDKAGRCRDGQTCSLKDARWIFAPANIDRGHWVSITIDREKKQIHCHDSNFSKGYTDLEPFTKIVSALCALLRGVDIADGGTGDNYTFSGHNPSFPQQENSYDCGVFVILTAYCFATGRRPNVSEQSLSIWRRYIAISLLEEGYRQ